jgi:superfamily II DNA or RNA helicase
VELRPGLYEQVVTDAVAAAISRLREGSADLEKVPEAQVVRAVSRHVAGLVEAALRAVPEEGADGRAGRQVTLANEIVDLLSKDLPRLVGERLATDELLMSVRPNPPATLPDRPLIPLSESALLTAAKDEPSMAEQLVREIVSAEEVDVIVAFVKWNGFRWLREPVSDLIARGGAFRLVTSTYMGGTDARAVHEFAKLGAQIRISYEMESTKLHAKAWLFRRSSGNTTGFIGSSNLSHSALVDGLEWNVRTSKSDAPQLIEHAQRTFDSYWASDRFEHYDPERDEEKLKQALAPAQTQGAEPDYSIFDLQPRPFQQRMLDAVEAERTRHDRWRNLIVSATGTGKTVMAAIDYRRLRSTRPRARLLFVAHRNEILRKSRSTFRAALRDGSFGEMLGHGERPSSWEHVFASVQSMNVDRLESLPRDQFDVIIVDEFHHAAASTYRRLLEHFEPRVLLGLTATPERADGEDVLAFFDGRIAAEMRLWEALDEQLLVPFHYFGIHDDVDLRAVGWRSGAYEVVELEQVYLDNTERVAKIVEAVREQVRDPMRMRAIGFCVSVRHAEFMAESFNAVGLRAASLTGGTPIGERERILKDLAQGRLTTVFAVDVLSEGVDIPEVDTILLLRPTESATVFLQQLGRGLRHAEGKSCLTVLDFIGQQRREFRFDRKLVALLGTGRRGIREAVENRFIDVPPGCRIELDRVAYEVVLSSVKEALADRSEKRLLEDLRGTGAKTLREFLELSGRPVEDVYVKGRSFLGLRAKSGAVPALSRDELSIARQLGSILHIEDPKRLGWCRDLAEGVEIRSEFPPAVRMILRSLTGLGPDALDAGLKRLTELHRIREDLAQLISELEDRVSVVHRDLPGAFQQSFMLHAKYTRKEIAAVLGKKSIGISGVYFDAKTATDFFLVTLRKTEAGFSPTTMYRDFALSPRLFHWESQGKTSLGSATGSRYVSGRSRPLLFVREGQTLQDGRTEAFTCLGYGSYKSHEGENPIAIVWELDHDMPAELFEVARAVST